MIQIKKAIANPELSENIADQNWLESDLSRLDDYEPYDWGELDPLTLGKPIKYVRTKAQQQTKLVVGL